MPKLVFTIVSRVALLATQQGSGYVSKADIASLLDQASLEKWNNEYGKGSQTRNGRQVPAIAYQVNQRVTDAMQWWLRVQKYSTDPTGITLSFEQDGSLEVPPDFVHPTSLTWAGAKAPIDVLDDAQVAYALSDPTEAPTADYPAAEVLPGRGYLPYPNVLAEVEASGKPVEITVKYLGTPFTPVYAEIRNGQGLVTGYDDAASVDTGWGPEATPWLVSRVTELLGIQEQNPQLAALGNKMVQDNT